MNGMRGKHTIAKKIVKGLGSLSDLEGAMGIGQQGLDRKRQAHVELTDKRANVLALNAIDERLQGVASDL
jgi:hypothetical protein